MSYLSSRIFYAIILYISIMTLLFIKKPLLLFDQHGNIKTFGVGNNRTIYSVGVLTVVTAILSFYLFCVIDMIFE